MARAFSRFFLGLWRSKPWVRIWVALLGAVNMAGAFLFWPAPEAVWTLAALGAAMLIMVALTAAQGFTRLLGVGHFVWFPLLAWLSTRLDLRPADSDLGAWIRVVMGLNAASLTIDLVDVARWLRGDRGEVA